MPVEITMPQLSDTMSEGTLVKWLKKVGDLVKHNEQIAEIETDKATMEMEAFEGGTIVELLVREGQKVAVGQVIARLATGRESTQPARASASAAVATPAPPPRQAALPSTWQQVTAGEIHERDEVGHGATRGKAQSVPAVSHTGNGERLRVSPLARKIAQDKQIDLTQVRGTGPNGRIVQRDLAAVSAPKPAVKLAPPVRLASGQTEVVPLSKMRLAIAKNLVASKQNLPHFYESIDVDVEDLSALRVRMNEMLESEKVRLSLGDFLAKGVATALLRNPALNATFDGVQITRHGDVRLGMAVSIPDGLIVPVLRNVQQMGLKEIRLASMDLVERARAQRLKPDEMRGATFTVSNLGTYGIREFSAIINPPEVGILAIAAAEKRPVVRNNQVVIRTMMTLTLSADHRVVDGATAAEFLRTLKGLLEEPGMMLV